MKERAGLASYAKRFGSGVLLSRVGGMVRDISMAMFFGDSPSVAAFMVAFRFSHFLRRILAEGSLQSIFLPHYKEIELSGKEKAGAFFVTLSLFLTGVSIVLCSLVWGAFALFPSWKTPTGTLFLYMFPSLVFLTLYGLNIAWLQCHNRFFAANAAPAACNGVWIVATIIFARYPIEHAMIGLSLSTVLGFVLQWLITVPQTREVWKTGLSAVVRRSFSFRKEWISSGKAGFFGLIGVIAMQVNGVLDMLFAKYVDPKGPVYLWYAIRLEQLPFAVIGLACVYSVTPSFTGLIKSGLIEKASELFAFGKKRLLLILVPCTAALCALALPAIELLFGRGAFSFEASSQTSFCLQAYGFALLPSVLVVYLSSVFFAYGDYVTPMKASLLSVTVNIVCNALFAFALPFGATGIAIATAIGAWANYLVLENKLPEEQRLGKASDLLPLFGKILSLSFLAYLASVFFDFLVFSTSYDRKFSWQTARFLADGSIFLLAFWGICAVWQQEILLEIKNFLFTKKESTPS